MYLSDVDLRQAIQCGDLIVEPPPTKEIGPTSIDLHLGPAEQAAVWDFEALAEHNRNFSHNPRELNIARMTYGAISRQYLVQVPREREAENGLAFRREDAIILRPHGFVLWQTEEVVGTPIVKILSISVLLTARVPEPVAVWFFI